jgi:hypothetical protein
MGQFWWLDTDSNCENFNKHIAHMRLSGKRPRVEFVTDKRTLSMNSKIYALYKQIAEQKQDESILDIKRHCKAYFGIPILLASDTAFAAMYEKGIMPHLTTEEKLAAMDILPVSSRMSVDMGCEYIDTIIREYSKEGISLMEPSEVEP